MVIWNPDRDDIHDVLKSTPNPSSPVGKHRARVTIARRIWAALQDLFKSP